MIETYVNSCKFKTMFSSCFSEQTVFNVNDALNYGNAMIPTNVKYTFTTMFVILLHIVWHLQYSNLHFNFSIERNI